MGIEVNPAPALVVTRHEPEVVVPAGTTPTHAYSLSNLDQNTGMIVKTVYMYSARGDMTGHDPVQVVKESLAKVLVQYYPVAGRMGLSPDFKLNINANAAGVVFVEAAVDIELVEIRDISQPDESLSELVYSVPGANLLEIPPASVQVTKFKCGGWALGLALNHTLFDGIGANEFVNAWAETARGLPMSLFPFLDRSILNARDPLEINFPHDEYADIEDLSTDKNLNLTKLNPKVIVYKSFCFSPEKLQALKDKVVREGQITKVTTFEALSGLTWRARTKALGMEPAQVTRVYFPVDGRQKFIPPLPKGYMGNGTVLTFSMTTAADLTEKPLSYAVKLVQDAIRLIDDRYMRSTIDYFEKTRATPKLTASQVITTWSRLPFHTTDFGWGEPTKQGPATLPEPFMALILSHGKERKGINMLLGLPGPAMEIFEKEMRL